MEEQINRPVEGQSGHGQSSTAESGVDRQHRRYRKFDEEFKREAVRLSELPGKTLASVARSLNIDVNTLGLWRKRFGTGAKALSAKPVGRPQGVQAADAGQSTAALQGSLDPAVVAMQLELMEVRKRLREAETERDILKKAMAVFARHQA